jgi:hypothetical protein
LSNSDAVISPRYQATYRERPASEGTLLLSLAGLALALLFVVSSSGLDITILSRAACCIFVFAFPQLVYEIINNKDNLVSHVNCRVDSIIIRKLLAFYMVSAVIYLIIILSYWCEVPRLKPTRDLLALCAPAILLLAIPYFCTTNAIQSQKDDEYLNVGRLLLGEYQLVRWAEVRLFVLSWIIKLFFFPLMFWELNVAIYAFDKALAADGQTWFAPYSVFISLIYVSDVCIAAAGYVATLRIFGWHIKSCSPYPIAWVVTLICYYPFYGYLYRSLLNYNDGFSWETWLRDYPALLVMWGAAIVVLKLTWIWSIAPFGLRFSNLTNRGIITDGAFRLSKHPSYISKNMFWWLMAVPFVSPEGASFAITNSLQLAAIGLIYFLRAKYEERHLSEDPRYVAYAMWIEKNGILRWIGSVCPVLRYTPTEIWAIRAAPRRARDR